MELSRANVVAAAERIRDHIVRTPVLQSEHLNRRCGKKILCKAEMLQTTGAFKFRGAIHAVLCHPSAKAFITHSSGNHGAALAMAARRRGIPCHVAFPENGSPIKKAAMERYGATIHVCGSGHQDREDKAAVIIADTGGQFIHPSDDPEIIYGQGTAALELITEFTDLEAVVAPVGGGGLISGTCLAASSTLPVYGAEPGPNGDAKASFDARQLQKRGQPHTVCDGLRTPLGPNTFRVITNHLHDMIEVTEQELLEWMIFGMQTLRVLIEPSSAVALAAAAKIDARRVGVILSGGNLDLTAWGMRGRPL